MEAGKPHAPAAAEPAPLLKFDKGKWLGAARRTLWGAILIGTFVAIILAGHAYLMALVLAIQAAAFYEIVRIAHEPGKERKLPYAWYLNWSFFLTANFYLYGEALLHFFNAAAIDNVHLQFASANHTFICYSLYITSPSL